MKPSYENLLVSSFLLYLDNRILTNSSGFYTYGSQFYPILQTYNGYTTYSAPFKPLIADASVPGATVMTGIYVNNVPITKGQSGLAEIDYVNGNLYFSSPLPAGTRVSGNYSFNEVAVNLSSFSDVTVLFETKLSLRPKVPQIPTGLFNNQLSYPIIFIKNEAGNNEPFAFGGMKSTKSEINAYIFAESQFQLDAICSNFKDALHEYVPLLAANEFPFNNMGGFKNNVAYNYTGLAGNRVSQGQGALITSVDITDFTKRGLTAEVQKMTTESFFSLATFTLEGIRYTH